MASPIGIQIAVPVVAAAALWVLLRPKRHPATTPEPEFDPRLLALELIELAKRVRSSLAVEELTSVDATIARLESVSQARRTDIWSPQVDDLVGGWVVSSYPHPLSEHDLRNDGVLDRFGYVIAECMSEWDAQVIADLLNSAVFVPTVTGRLSEHFSRRLGALSGGSAQPS